MMGLQIRRAFEIVFRTGEYVLYRAAMYGALCVCVIAYLAMLAAIGGVFGPGAFWVLFVMSAGLAGVLGISGFINEYIFHRLRAGHIALIVEILTQGEFPTGISQIKWARGRVAHYFKGVGTLARLRRYVRDSVRSFNRGNDLSLVMPLPGVEGGTVLERRVVEVSQGYIEEAMFAYAFRAKSENIYESAKQAMLMYSQSWRVILGSSVMLTLVSYGFALVSTVIFLIPLGIIALALPENFIKAFPDEYTIARFVLFFIGVFLGFASKWTLFDPLASASITVSFFEESDLTALDSEQEESLARRVPAFQSLRAEAASYEPVPEFKPAFEQKEAAS